ncbi:ABC transporter substrate-binding protein [Nitriliruptor alkaliphilus]|uniref:ABC transporter substrate-binding protein n=1 Tax=Nitriliruptor alkaliphilus TaxID=427918 RepID=UPI000697F203|nr:ABC transporter substrate-binding protein [Nitriliruptor alkaliphilus]
MLVTKRSLRPIAAAATVALVAAACGGDGGSAADGAAADDVGAAPAHCGDIQPEDLDGAGVSIFGAPTSVEADAFNAVIEDCFNGPFNANGVYEGSDSFETQVLVRIEGGNAPDIAMYPQPGSIIELAERGTAIALEDLGFDTAELEATFGEYLLSLGEFEGKHYGLPTNVSLKSLIWYNKPVFEANGYEIPETWDELLALSQQIVDDGSAEAPFCIGTGSDAATGWPATDWLEDVMLRTAGPDTYDQWVSHEIPFDDPAVVDAANTFAEIAFNPDFVVGRTSDIPGVDFRDAAHGMFSPSIEEPACVLHRQASFITSFFPEETEVGTDVDVFPFPAVDPDQPTAALIAGELAAVLNDTPAVRAFLSTLISEGVQCTLGGYEGVQRISPNVNTSGDCYTDDVVARSADTIVEALKAGGARFDASDLMPSIVGTGSFWTAMNEWMRGADIEQVLADVEASWPSS